MNIQEMLLLLTFNTRDINIWTFEFTNYLFFSKQEKKYFMNKHCKYFSLFFKIFSLAKFETLLS